MAQVDEQVLSVLKSIEELKSQDHKKVKDGWDKAAVIAQIFSGVVLGLVGVGVTVFLNRGQAAQSATQNELQRRQLASQYAGLIAGQNVITLRAELVRGLDVALSPSEAVQIAMRYSIPNKNEAADPVSVAGTGVLERLRKAGREELLKIEKDGNFQESEMARALLDGKNDRVFVRVSEVDDFIDIAINAEPVGRTFQFGEDSGWIPISHMIRRGTRNDLQFTVKNSPYEGCGGRLQLSAGVQQYDYSVSLTSCPPNQQAFRVGYPFNVDKIGNVVLLRPSTILKRPTDWHECIEGCIPTPKFSEN